MVLVCVLDVGLDRGEFMLDAMELDCKTSQLDAKESVCKASKLLLDKKEVNDWLL